MEKLDPVSMDPTMLRHLDLTRERFGRWEVLRLMGRDKRLTVHWLCRCECGTERTVSGTSLRNGRSTSCGCLKGITHGLSRLRAYKSWDHMIERCTNPNNPSFKDYGARGIAVCKRWLSVESFIADMGERAAGMTLERIDNNRGYSPKNCRWAPKGAQARNRRHVIWMIAPDGTRLALSEFAKASGLNYATLYDRIRNQNCREIDGHRVHAPLLKPPRIR